MTSYQRRVPRECRACGARQPKEYGIPDPCLGMLPGVRNACCGHGNRWHCYVQDESFNVVREDEARALQIGLGGDPAPFDRDEPVRGGMEGWQRIP